MGGRMKRAFSLLLSLYLIMSLTVPAAASPKATARVDVTVRPDSIVRIGAGLSLETGELVTVNCAYSPRIAEVDFGLVSANNEFGYFSGNDGICSETIRISKTGIYYFAIRNNSEEPVEVAGYVYY